MVQFYFLSVLLNLICGLILVYGKSDEDSVEDEGFADDSKLKGIKDAVSSDGVFSNDIFKFVIGLLSVLVGVIKLLFAFGSNGAGLPILGDLLPALLGIAGGASILIMYYEDKSEITIPEAVSSLLIPNKVYIGAGCIVIAILHFIVPAAIIL